MASPSSFTFGQPAPRFPDAAAAERRYVDKTTMTSSQQKLELESSTETIARGREVQLLINIAEPDPEYQPGVLTDDASLLDAVPTEPREIARRLDAYFRGDLELDFALPLWRLVDTIKRLRPGWPDDLEPN